MEESGFEPKPSGSRIHSPEPVACTILGHHSLSLGQTGEVTAGGRTHTWESAPSQSSSLGKSKRHFSLEAASPSPKQDLIPCLFSGMFREFVSVKLQGATWNLRGILEQKALRVPGVGTQSRTAGCSARRSVWKWRLHKAVLTAPLEGPGNWMLCRLEEISPDHRPSNRSAFNNISQMCKALRFRITGRQESPGTADLIFILVITSSQGALHSLASEE